MFVRQLRLLTLVLVLGAVSAQGQDFSTISKGGSLLVEPSAAWLVATHDGLAATFRRLSATATSPTAKTADRQALAAFVRTKIVPQLTQESFVLYPAFDSIVGGGYAVPATLFDLDGVAFLVKEVERTAGSGERAAFETRVYALGFALEGYYTKVQLLVLPVLSERLGPTALGLVLSKLDVGRANQ